MIKIFLIKLIIFAFKPYLNDKFEFGNRRKQINFEKKIQIYQYRQAKSNGSIFKGVGF
jgi:hypothetical protein